MTQELARREKIANDHREALFSYVLVAVSASLGLVALAVALVGMKVISLDTPVIASSLGACSW